jgi:hypothetical protein
LTIVQAYTGPQCPRCAVTLTADWIYNGAITCPYCGRAFEATVFDPPQRAVEATTEVIDVGPDGANACANHMRNAATASCQRCGLFICALCDMNVGTGSYCPTCFDRVRADGSLLPAARRYRDFAGIARASALTGLLLSLFFLGIPFGALAVYFGVKARKQQKTEGRSTFGTIIAILAGILEILGGLAYLGFLLYAIGKDAT